MAVTLKNKKDLAIDRVEYSIDGKVLPVKDGKITLDVKKLVQIETDSTRCCAQRGWREDSNSCSHQ